MTQLDEVRHAKALHSAAILSKPNVVGVGVGYKTKSGRMTRDLSIIALVRQKISLPGLSPTDRIPGYFGGISTDVLQVGDIRPLSLRTDRWRPAPGGVSIGHYRITAGTLGAVVVDRQTRRRLILSNNHVLANSNDGEPGDPILQPAAVDGGEIETDTIARLNRFCPIQFSSAPPTCELAKLYANFGNALADLVGSGHHLNVIKTDPLASNLVDAAVAEPVADSDIGDEILEIGEITGATQPALGMLVRKSGRTTGLKSGEILVLDTTISVEYGAGRSATFEGQILTGPISQGGDSGSLLVSADSPRAVGLLFAGSSEATIHNPIQAVLDCLDVEFASQKSMSKKLEMETTVEKAQAVKQAYTSMLMAKANVVGVGVGIQRKAGSRTGEIGLVVTVRKKMPRSQLAPEDIIPGEIEGIPVDVKEVGDVRAQ